MIARAIIQMMGSPKKHIEETLGVYVDKIKDEHKNIKVVKEDRSKAEKDGDMYKVFTELEIDTKSASDLVWFCFDYMPSSVEIIEPDEIIYDSRDFTDFLNDLQAKLHKLDTVVKNLSAENQVVKKNGVMLMKNIIMLQLKMKPRDLETLAVNAGVPQDHMEKFLKAMEKEGKIKKDGNLYILA